MGGVKSDYLERYGPTLEFNMAIREKGLIKN